MSAYREGMEIGGWDEWRGEMAKHKTRAQQLADDRYDRYVTRLAGSTDEEYGHIEALTLDEAELVIKSSITTAKESK